MCFVLLYYIALVSYCYEGFQSRFGLGDEVYISAYTLCTSSYVAQVGYIVQVGYILYQLWVKTRVVFFATVVMVPPTGTRATVATEITRTTLPTAYDTLLVSYSRYEGTPLYLTPVTALSLLHAIWYKLLLYIVNQQLSPCTLYHIYLIYVGNGI